MSDDIPGGGRPPADSTPPPGQTENEGVELGGAPGQTLRTDPPTHVYKQPDGSVSIVFPDGHDPGSLIELPRPPTVFEHWDDATGAFVLDVAAANAALQAQIDEGVGALRRQFVTDITGQQAAYARKFDEATSLLAGGAGPFPMLTGEAALKSMSVADLAAQVAGLGNLWVQLDNAVEAKRCGAKWMVEQATTFADKQVAATVDWGALIAPILEAAQG